VNGKSNTGGPYAVRRRPVAVAVAGRRAPASAQTLFEFRLKS
jgi:hypothetical protein